MLFWMTYSLNFKDAKFLKINFFPSINTIKRASQSYSENTLKGFKNEKMTVKNCRHSLYTFQKEDKELFELFQLEIVL